MNPNTDVIEHGLRTLRGLAWEHGEHQRRLEKELMETQTWWQRRSWKSKAALIGGLVLAGGVAGATTMTAIEHWMVTVDDVTITGDDLPGDQMQLTFTKTATGEVLSSEAVPDDTALISIPDEQGGHVVLGVRGPIGEDQAPHGDK
jgi:hypothetical protein